MLHWEYMCLSFTQMTCSTCIFSETYSTMTLSCKALMPSWCRKRGGHYRHLGQSCSADASWWPPSLDSALWWQRLHRVALCSQTCPGYHRSSSSINEATVHCNRAQWGVPAALHSPLIKILLTGSWEEQPSITGLTPVQVVKENYFCLNSFFFILKYWFGQKGVAVMTKNADFM